MLDFKVQLKHGTEGTERPVRIVAYSESLFRYKGKDDKSQYLGGRFVYYPGIKAAKVNKKLGAKWIEIAETAFKSLEDEGKPVNATSLKGRIDLVRHGLGWVDNELTIWNEQQDKAEYYVLPVSVNRESLESLLQKELQKSSPDFKKVINRLIGNGKKELFGFWKSVLDGEIIPTKRAEPLTDSTIKAKRQTYEKVLKFDPDATFDSINDDFKDRFVTWLRKDRVEKQVDETGKTVDVKVKRLDENSIGTHIKEIKAIMKFAFDRRLTKNIEYQSWTVGKFKNEVITLTKNELLHLIDLPLTEAKSRIRDMFCLACFNGARIGDYKNIRIKNVDGEKYFTYVSGKTGAFPDIPIHDRAQKILDRRGGKMPQMISEQKFREALKEIFETAGFDEEVVTRIRKTPKGNIETKKPKFKAMSPHTSRRVFATSCFEGWFTESMPAAIIMLFTGHKTESSFLRYIGSDKKQLAALALGYFKSKPKEHTMKVSA